ncbi:MAG: DJ-1/PfpI family protein [candidate division Zixibacteria bacterium]|nr:DJ-1/PfpI family protein [candidate division Zixibacteria bacterium]
MSKRVLMILAEGFEDVEAIAPIDVLNRAGVEVTIVSLVMGPVKAAYGTTIVPHKSIDQIDDTLYDGVIFPGGRRNAQALAAHPRVREIAIRHYRAGKMVAAICAAPSHVLGEACDLLRGRRATGDPSFNDKLSASGALITDELVTVDGNIVTGMGPGAAMPFALRLAEYLSGKAVADEFAAKWRISR